MALLHLQTLRLSNELVIELIRNFAPPFLIISASGSSRLAPIAGGGSVLKEGATEGSSDGLLGTSPSDGSDVALPSPLDPVTGIVALPSGAGIVALPPGAGIVALFGWTPSSGIITGSLTLTPLVSQS